MAEKKTPTRCDIDGCDAPLVETIHPGVSVCLSRKHAETPVFEARKRGKIERSTGHVIALSKDD